LALGTDTGGSVRVPASFCGVYAMRPTHGRVSLAGVLPFAPSYDTVAWFARDATLLRSAGRVLLGSAPGPTSQLLKLSIAGDALALADAPVQEALRAWAERTGVSTLRSAYGGGDWRDWLQAYATLQGLEIQEQLGPWIRERRPSFGANIGPRFEDALALDTAMLPRWQQWRKAAAQNLIERLKPDEAWLVPAAPCTALLKTANGPERGVFYERALALCALAGHAGLPQVVLPLVTVHGLPVGVSFIGARGSDERLLDLALALSPAAGSDR
jgi:amidase